MSGIQRSSAPEPGELGDAVLVANALHQFQAAHGSGTSQCPVDQPAGFNHPGAQAFAGQNHGEVALIRTGSAPPLGEGSQLGVIFNDHGPAEAVPEFLSQPKVEHRSQLLPRGDGALGGDLRGNAQGDAQDALFGYTGVGQRGLGRCDDCGASVGRSASVVREARLGAAHHVAGQVGDHHTDGGQADVEPQDKSGTLVELEPPGGAALLSAEAGGGGLPGPAPGNQVIADRNHRGAGQSGGLDEIRSRGGGNSAQHVEDRAQIGAAQQLWSAGGYVQS